MYGCESWTMKKAEHRRIDAFELWCWRRLLRVPWTARRSNQSILKETSPGCSLEGLMLKLNLQYFGHLIQRADSLEKTLMLRKIEGRRRRGRQRMRWLDGITYSMDMSFWKSSGSWWWTGKPGVLQSRGSQRVERDWVTELNWINNHVLEERMSVMEIDPNSDSLLDINEEQMNRRDSFEFNDRQLMEERDERKFISETTLWFVLCSITF